MSRLSLVPVLALTLALSVSAQTLQFKDGAVLIGEVTQAHEEGLTFLRLDNGGVLELKWSHLSTDCAGRIKRLFNLAGDEQDEVTVIADEVAYEIAGVANVVLGKIVERRPTELIVQRRGIQMAVPKESLKSLRQVEVPVTQIYTREEFYSSKLVELAPGEDADQHVALADELMRVRDYDNAEVHLLQAKELGTSLQPRAIDERLLSVRRFKGAQEEAELLHQISVRRNREQFAVGLELIAQFEQQYPDSRLQSEFEKEKRRFANARLRYLTGEVNGLWKKLIRSTVERKVGERDVTLSLVREYAERQMGEDIVARIAEMLDLDPTEVRELWEKRLEYPGLARREHFSYGIGSWVLGDAALLADTEQGEREEDEAARSSAEDREIERFARRIRQARERAGRSRGGQPGAGSRTTEEDWWEQADRNQRVGFLRAYYAERGGDLLLHRAYVKNCVNCAGTGRTEQLAGTGRVVQVECFLCHGKRYVRTLRAY